MRTPRRIALVAVLLATTGAATGSAADYRLSPARDFATNGPWGPKVSWSAGAVNDAGDAVVAGTVNKTTTTSVWVRQRVQPRGSWSKVTRLAPLTADTGTVAASINATGRSVVIFRQAGQLMAASRLRTGPWSAPTAVGIPLTNRAVVQVVSLDSGAARVVVATPDATCVSLSTTCAWTVRTADQSATMPVWAAAPVPLTVPAVEGNPKVAMSRSGDALVAWVEPGPTKAIHAARSFTGQFAFETPAPVTGALATSPFLRSAAIGGAGQAAVAWTIADAAGPLTVRGQVSRRTATALAWDPAEDLIPAGSGPAALGVAVDENGATLVAWAAKTSTSGDQLVSNVAVRGITAPTWTQGGTPITSIPASISDQAPAHIAFGAGRMAVIWDTHGGPGDNTMTLSYLSEAGSWVSLTNLTASGYPPGVMASSPAGKILTVDGDMVVRNFDAALTSAIPVISRFSVRTSGRTVIVAFRANLPTTVFVSRRRVGGTDVNRVPVTRPAGVTVLRLGPLARATYTVNVAACHTARGCATKSGSVRVR